MGQVDALCAAVEDACPIDPGERMCNARKDGRDLQVQGLLNKGSHAFINKHVRNGEHIEEVDKC